MRYLEGKDREQFSCSPALSDIFIEWFLGVTIDNFGTIEWDMLWNLMSDNYNLSSAERAIFEYANDAFKHGDAFSLDQKQERIYETVKSYLFALHKNNQEALKIDLASECNELLISVECSKVILRHTQFKEIDLQLLYFDYLRNKDSILGSLTDALNKADENKKLEELFVCDGIEQLYSYLGVKYVSDLKKAPIDNVANAFFFTIHQLIQNIQLSDVEAISLLENKMTSVRNILMDENRSDYDLVTESQGIGNRLTKPSQKEMNKKYGIDPLTVERKKREMLKRVEELDGGLIQLLSVVLLSKIGKQKYYDYELLTDLFERETLDLLCLIAEYSNNILLSYDRKHYIFYNPSSKKIDDLLDNISDEMNDLIRFNEYVTFTLLKKKLVSERWSKKEKYYLRKELTELKLAIAVMDEKFPQGYHIQNDYELLCKYLREEYGDDFDCPSVSVITWKLQKDDHFCQVDRGTYLPWNKCPDLNLLEQAAIVDYIQNAGDIVYYASIFEHFKDEFKKKGVANQYFVKGIVDHYIDGYGYEMNRDFIKKEGSSITGKQAILQKIMEFDGAFSIQQLRNEFPGVKDYTFQVVIQENDEIISLGENKYVVLVNSGVTAEGEDIMVDEAQNALRANDGRPVIAKKILTKIKLFYDDWKKELGLITTPTALYCFLSRSERANELFEFKRPYLAFKGTNKDEMNFSSSLFKSLSELDEIDYDTFRKTVVDIGGTKTHPINFIDIFEEMCDEYLLVDRFRLLRISKLFVNRSEIETIKAKLLALLNKKKHLDSEAKTNFKSLPKQIAGLPMNEYLLLGIVATYLQNSFDYELTTRGAKLTYKIKEA